MPAGGPDRRLRLLAAEGGQRACHDQCLASQRPRSGFRRRGAGLRGFGHDAGVQQMVQRIPRVLVGEVPGDRLGHDLADPEHGSQLLGRRIPEQIGGAAGPGGL